MLAGEVTAILGAKVNPSGFAAYDAAMGRATASAAKAEAAQGKMTASMVAGAGASSKFATAAKGAAVGGALVLAAGLAKSISAAAQFDKQMDRIGAVTQANSKDMKAMSEIAKDLGAKMGVGATQAAVAMEALAKGGLTTKQIIGGGLAGALQLAQAGSMDLGAAAEATANALNLFGLGGGQATHVADALAVAAKATTADVSDFALALAQGGSAAKLAGLSFDETVVALESLAKIGVKGSDAGTSLKAALLQVLDPTKEASATMKQLGIDFTDSSGKMKPLADIADLLAVKLDGLSKEQQVAALKTMAGTDGFRALAALAEQGNDGVVNLSKGLKQQGDAARVAKENTDNLSGSWNRFKASIQNLAIEASGPFLEPLQDGLDSLGKSLDDLRSGKGDLAAVVNDVKAIGSAVGDVFDFLNVGTGFSKIFGGLGQAAKGALDTLRSIVQGDIRGIFSGLGNVVAGSLKAITAPLVALGPLLIKPFVFAADKILGVWSQLMGGLSSSMSVLGKLPGGGMFKDLAAGIDEARDKVDGLRESLRGVGDEKPKAPKVDVDAAVAAIQQLQGTDLEPKVLKILGSDDDAKTKIKKLEALGIDPKDAVIIAQTAEALGKIDRLQKIIDGLRGNEVPVKAVGDAWAKVQSLAGMLSRLESKTINVNTVYTETMVKHRQRAAGRGPGGSEVALVGEGRHAREAVVDPKTGMAAMVSGPTIMPLSSSAYVIPEDPMQRGKSMGLLAMLAEDLGLRGFAASKTPAKRGKAKAPAAKKARYIPPPLDPLRLPVDELDGQADDADKAESKAHAAIKKAKTLHKRLAAAKAQLKRANNLPKTSKNKQTNIDAANKKVTDADSDLDNLPHNGSLAKLRADEKNRRADAQLRRKEANRARAFQKKIDIQDAIANTGRSEMQVADGRDDADGYAKAKKKRADALTERARLLGEIRGVLDKLGGDYVTGKYSAEVDELIAATDVDRQENDKAAEEAPERKVDNALSQEDQDRLDVFDQNVALAQLTEPTGDDVTRTTERRDFLEGLLGTAQASGRSAGVVGELATLVKQARDDVKGLTTQDRAPDLQAQLDQQRQISDLAIGNAQANARALAVFSGSGDIGSGGGNAFGAVNNWTINTLHPGSPDTLAAIAAASNAGNSLQNGIASSRLRVG